MSHDTRTTSKSQPNCSDHTHRKIQSKHTSGSVLAIAAGTVLCLASASTNAIYGWSRTDVLASQITWAAVSISASAILALAPTTFLKATKSRSLAGAIFAVLALALCGAYSFSAAIGASAGQRMTSQAVQTDADDTRTRLKQAYDAANEELLGLPKAVATVAELDAQIAVLKQTPGAAGCPAIDGPVTKRVCPQVADLEAQKARANRRADLQAAIADATGKLDKLGPPKPANTDAAALSAYLAVAGIKATPDAINRWLALLAVLLVEFGGGLAFAVSTVLREPAMADATGHEDRQPSNARNTQGVDTVDCADELKAEVGVQRPSTPNPAKLQVPDDFGGRLLVMLKDRGGELYSGHRALGSALGCSPSHVGNVLKELSAGGHVTVNATKTGTVVRLTQAA